MGFVAALQDETEKNHSRQREVVSRFAEKSHGQLEISIRARRSGSSVRRHGTDRQTWPRRGATSQCTLTNYRASRRPLIWQPPAYELAGSSICARVFATSMT